MEDRLFKSWGGYLSYIKSGPQCQILHYCGLNLDSLMILCGKTLVSVLSHNSVIVTGVGISPSAQLVSMAKNNSFASSPTWTLHMHVISICKAILHLQVELNVCRGLCWSGVVTRKLTSPSPWCTLEKRWSFLRTYLKSI